jgi:hypothetical protein
MPLWKYSSIWFSNLVWSNPETQYGSVPLPGRQTVRNPLYVDTFASPVSILPIITRIGRGGGAADHYLVNMTGLWKRRVASVLGGASFAYLAVETSSGPHVTPLLFAATPDRLWFVIGRGTLKARVRSRERPSHATPPDAVKDSSRSRR